MTKILETSAYTLMKIKILVYFRNYYIFSLFSNDHPTLFKDKKHLLEMQNL
jgi:hypothetical protein